MTTKNTFILTILWCFTVVLVSCSSDETRLANLEKGIKQLQDSLKNINEHIVQPFEEFQTIIMHELDNPPAVSIEKYDKLIKDHGNTYWAHESRRRIKNIKDRSEYWTQEKGWKLDEEKEKEKGEGKGKGGKRVHVVASCPGC